MNTIGEKVKTRVVADLDEMWNTYLDDIDTAFMEAEGSLTVTMSAKLDADGEGGVAIETKLSFTKGKVSEKYESTVNERQMELPV